MRISQADAKFLRSILFVLILSTVVVGAAAGFAAVNGGGVDMLLAAGR